MAKKAKTVEQVVREIAHPKPRRGRRKSEAQAWYEAELAKYRASPELQTWAVATWAQLKVKP